MDELAAAAGADPVAFRLRAPEVDPRARDVVTQGRGASSGGTRRPACRTGHGRGFAFARYKNLGAYCAVALEVAVEHENGPGARGPGGWRGGQRAGRQLRRHPQPDRRRGAAVLVSWTMLRGGRVRTRPGCTSRDWGGYPILRFPAVPDSVAVHVIDRPGMPFLGTGEAAQGPTAAAIANALYDAAKVRIRQLPLSSTRVKAAIGV